MDNLISHLDNLVKIGEDDFVSMLSHTTLDKGADFVGIDFSESDLSYITFDSYNFQSTNFSKSDLSSSIFRKCDLRRADFRHCILENTLFENCQTDNALGIPPEGRLRRKSCRLEPVQSSRRIGAAQ